MTGIELVVTDLDGTLWGLDEVVHPRSATTLAELEALGVSVVAATGRPRRRARSALAEHGLQLDTVLHDGALGVRTDDVVFHSCPFSADQARHLIEVFVTFDLQPMFETDDPDTELILGDRPSLPRPPRQPHLICDLTLELPLPVFRAMAVVEPVTAQALSDAIASSGAGQSYVSPRQSDKMLWILVRPPTCSKWAAVMSYCQAVGADPTRVLAIGDGDNDIELLANARVALAPRTASPLARDHADHLIAPPDEGGWADVVRFL